MTKLEAPSAHPLPSPQRSLGDGREGPHRIHIPGKGRKEAAGMDTRTLMEMADLTRVCLWPTSNIILGDPNLVAAEWPQDIWPENKQ